MKIISKSNASRKETREIVSKNIMMIEQRLGNIMAIEEKEDCTFACISFDASLNSRIMQWRALNEQVFFKSTNVKKKFQRWLLENKSLVTYTSHQTHMTAIRMNNCFFIL